MTEDARACGGQAKKDPNEPKRSKSSYMLFCDEQRAKVKAENPELSMTGAAACVLFAPVLLALCRGHASSMHPLCTLYAPSMHPLCTLYAPSMHPLRTLYAPSMLSQCMLPLCAHPRCSLYVCSFYACSLHACTRDALNDASALPAAEACSTCRCMWRHACLPFRFPSPPLRPRAIPVRRAPLPALRCEEHACSHEGWRV